MKVRENSKERERTNLENRLAVVELESLLLPPSDDQVERLVREESPDNFPNSFEN